jgi:hypothetical protein
MAHAALSSDAEAVELVRRNGRMDPRKNPDMILGPVSSVHRGRWSESTQLCSVGERLLVHHTARRREFLGGLVGVEFRNGRTFELTLFRGSSFQVRLQLGN